MADLIAITKADGANKLIAEGARVSFQNALHLFPKKTIRMETPGAYLFSTEKYRY